MNFSLTRVRLIAATLLVLSVALVAVIVIDVTGTPRTLLVVVFGLLAPGWSVVAFLPPMSAALEWATAISLSLAVSVLIGTTMLALGSWHPTTAFVALVLATCCALVWHLLRPTPAVIGILEIVDDGLVPATPEARRPDVAAPTTRVDQAGHPSRP